MAAMQSSGSHHGRPSGPIEREGGERGECGLDGEDRHLGREQRRHLRADRRRGAAQRGDAGGDAEVRAGDAAQHLHAGGAVEDAARDRPTGGADRAVPRLGAGEQAADVQHDGGADHPQRRAGERGAELVATAVQQQREAAALASEASTVSGTRWRAMSALHRRRVIAPAGRGAAPARGRLRCVIWAVRCMSVRVPATASCRGPQAVVASSSWSASVSWRSSESVTSCRPARLVDAVQQSRARPGRPFPVRAGRARSRRSRRCRVARTRLRAEEARGVERAVRDDDGALPVGSDLAEKGRRGGSMFGVRHGALPVRVNGRPGGRLRCGAEADARSALDTGGRGPLRCAER